MKKIAYILLVAALAAACGGKQSTGSTAAEDEPILVGPSFSADTALMLCAKQCAFGPRTMNSAAHEECLGWIISQFEKYGCQVSTQKADLKGWDGTMLRSTNVIASLWPEKKHRIIVCAHWDCRPWADNDPDSSNWHKPIVAANDAASGVAVMMELARIIHSDTTQLHYGIDFVCFDAEDYGAPQWSGKEDEASWALGAQYFAQHLPANYDCGLLLDMVGGQGAHFYQEGYSMHYARQQVGSIWQAADDAGYGSIFLRRQGGTITDDHKPLNEAGIPTVDIIPYYPDCPQSGFGPTWHTVSDDMQHIDPATLKAVGQTVVQYIYTR